jgi:predicted methyltransferase
VNTIYFWPQPAIVFDELFRVLHADGRLVVSFRTPAALDRQRASPAFARYDGDEVARMMEQAGFGGIAIVPGSDRGGDFLSVAGNMPAA